MNYIIYNSNEKLSNKIIDIIQDNSNKQTIEFFKDYTQELKEFIHKNNKKQVYILNIDTKKDIYAINIAKEIRKNDWTSIIIFTTNNESIINSIAKQRLMFFSIVSTFDNFEENFNYCIEDIETIFNIESSKEILYIFSKNKFTFIVTKSEMKKTRASAYYIANNYNLIQTHKSYYINLANVKSIDFEHNTVIFNNNKSIHCISARLKSKIKREFSLYKHNI